MDGTVTSVSVLMDANEESVMWREGDDSFNVMSEYIGVNVISVTVTCVAFNDPPAKMTREDVRVTLVSSCGSVPFGVIDRWVRMSVPDCTAKIGQAGVEVRERRRCK